MDLIQELDVLVQLDEHDTGSIRGDKIAASIDDMNLPPLPNLSKSKSVVDSQNSETNSDPRLIESSIEPEMTRDPAQTTIPPTTILSNTDQDYALTQGDIYLDNLSKEPAKVSQDDINKTQRYQKNGIDQSRPYLHKKKGMEQVSNSIMNSSIDNVEDSSLMDPNHVHLPIF